MLLVSNDFPPKVGGIQNYLYELWTRLPYSDTRVITTKYKGSREFDAKQDFEIDRYSKILWPTPKLISHVNSVIKEMKTDVVFIDPLLPTGLIASYIKDVKKVLIVHGAEVTVPGRLWPSKPLVKHIARNCDYVIGAGNYAPRELVLSTGEPISMCRIAPGVDTGLFSCPTPNQKEIAKAKLTKELGMSENSKIVMTASRLVPRKGFDYAIKAIESMDDDIHLVIVGTGRDQKRLKKIVAERNLTSRVHFLGRIAQDQLIDTFHASDVFIMLCRDRWGSLEAEGFGIVFLEAQSCGLPVIVGRSGGSDEALVDGVSGYMVDPRSLTQIREKLQGILSSQELQKNMSQAGREFVEKYHSYDYLASILTPIVGGDFSSFKTFEG